MGEGDSTNVSYKSLIGILLAILIILGTIASFIFNNHITNTHLDLRNGLLGAARKEDVKNMQREFDIYRGRLSKVVDRLDRDVLAIRMILMKSEVPTKESGQKSTSLPNISHIFSKTNHGIK